MNIINRDCFNIINLSKEIDVSIQIYTEYLVSNNIYETLGSVTISLVQNITNYKIKRKE